MLVQKNFGGLIKSFALTAILFIVTYFTLGFYYEEIEAFFDLMYSGKLTPGYPFPSWYYMGHIGISYIYSALYQTNGNIEWMSWILYAYMYISCSVLLFFTWFVLKDKYSGISIIALQVILFLVFQIDNIINFQYTRIATFICSASILSLILLFRRKEQIARNKTIFVLLNLFYLVGTLTRLECSMAVVFIATGFAVFYLQNLKQAIRLLIFPSVCVLGTFGGIMYDIKHTDFFYKRVEPDIETQITVRGNIVPISSMTTERDSARYTAAVNMLWGDPHVVTVEFLRSLLVKGKPFLSDAKQWKRVKNDVEKLVSKYKYTITYSIILCLLNFIFIYNGNKKSAAFYFLFLSFFSILIILQTYYVKINDRSFFPVLAIFCYLNILVALRLLAEKHQLLGYLFALVTLVTALKSLEMTFGNAKILEQEWLASNTNMNVVKSIAKDEILLLNTSTIRLFSIANKPFQTFTSKPFHRVYINEAQILTTMPPYKNYLESQCNCDVSNFSNFFRHTMRIKDRKVYILSSSYRMQLITNYLRSIHNLELKPVEVVDYKLQKVYDHERLGILDLNLYRIN